MAAQWINLKNEVNYNIHYPEYYHPPGQVIVNCGTCCLVA